MGIDLKVLATKFREKPTEMLATASILLDRDRRLLTQLLRESVPCLVQSMPEGLKVGHYEDTGVQFDDQDRYQKPLTFTTPGQLQALKDVEQLSEYNKAAVAFLLNLPPQTRIVLYWC